MSGDILPKSSFWDEPDVLTQLEGFWLVSAVVDLATTFRSNFDARDDDTTPIPSPPPSSSRPCPPPPTPSSTSTTPRLLHTHLPYSILPGSIKNSACKIVYIVRSPKDTLISMWHFFNATFRRNQEPLSLEKAVDWPKKILFLKYEEIKSDPKREISVSIAEFLGMPLAEEGEVDQLLWRCSLERLKNLEVNSGDHGWGLVPNAAYFRKGQVGDWKNYLTSQTEDRIHQTVGLKLEALGLFFYFKPSNVCYSRCL
ncbi:hydroxyjasmonate sulfotransferase [Salvia divinorum]|uniref:Sulfotransferase n=1 Tax=Salvia divinorum TaxID=28513 RepID=A0ABD1FVF7_SALDI